MTDRVFVDYDNTLTVSSVAWWEDEVPEPNVEMVEWTRDQYAQGHTIVVWTARPWSEANKIAARLTEWEVPFHGVRCEKGSADRYVDDKSKRPEEVV